MGLGDPRIDTHLVGKGGENGGSVPSFGDIFKRKPIPAFVGNMKKGDIKILSNGSFIEGKALDRKKPDTSKKKKI